MRVAGALGAAVRAPLAPGHSDCGQSAYAFLAQVATLATTCTY